MIQETIEELKESDFDSHETRPEAAAYSAFGEGDERETELKIKPKHENYMAFIKDFSDSEDEGKVAELPKPDDDKPLLFRLPSWDGKEASNSVSISEGEVVRITDDQKLLRSECLRAELHMNERKYAYLGQQGKVVFTDGATAKVRFPTLGESFFPLTCIRPVTDIPNNVKETIELVFARVTNNEQNQSPRAKKKRQRLNPTQLRELLSITYPDLTKVEIEAAAKKWTESSSDLTLSDIHTCYSEVFAADDEEMYSIRQRLEDFLVKTHIEVQIGMVGDVNMIHVPVESNNFRDVLTRVAAYEDCERTCTTLIFRGKRYSLNDSLERMSLKDLTQNDNRPQKIFAVISRRKVSGQQRESQESTEDELK